MQDDDRRRHEEVTASRSGVADAMTCRHEDRGPAAAPARSAPAARCRTSSSPRPIVLFVALPRCCRSATRSTSACARAKVSGLGPRAGHRDRVFVGLDNYRDALRRRRVLARLGGGCSATARSWCRSCSGWRCCSRCCWTRRGSGWRRFSPHRDLPAVRGAGRHRLPAVGLPLPARPQPDPRRCSRALGLPEPDLLGRARRSSSIANIAVWGGVGFNMLVLYTALRAIPRELLRGGPHRRLLRVADRAADQDPADRARRSS